MGRDDEALRRRLAESQAAADAEESSGNEGSTYQARDGITSWFDPAERRLEAAEDDDSETRVEAQLDRDPRDPRLDQPPDLPQSGEVSHVAPDGTSIGRGTGFTSPTGESIGGSTLSDQVQGRGAELGGDALGGSRLDPLGMLDAGASGDVDGLSSGGPGGIDRIVMGRDGSLVSADDDPPPGGLIVRDGDGNVVYEGNSKDFAPAPALEVIDPDKGVVYSVQDFPEPEPHSGPVVTEQPDPTGGYDVITQSTIDAALKTNDPGVYAQPAQDGESHDTAASVARSAALNNPDQVTNYGPEGEQTVEAGANWAPPPDTIFDPPPEASAMADAGAVVGGSVVGSSNEPDFPPPPDPPPGDDPDQGPSGPPPDGGGDS